MLDPSVMPQGHEQVNASTDDDGIDDRVHMLVRMATDRLGDKDGEWTMGIAGQNFQGELLRERGIHFGPTVGSFTLVPGSKHVQEIVLETEKSFYDMRFNEVETSARPDYEAYIQKWLEWYQNVAAALRSIPEVLDYEQGLVRWPHSFQLRVENNLTRYTVRFVAMTLRIPKNHINSYLIP